MGHSFISLLLYEALKLRETCNTLAACCYCTRKFSAAYFYSFSKGMYSYSVHVCACEWNYSASITLILCNAAVGGEPEWFSCSKARNWISIAIHLMPFHTLFPLVLVGIHFRLSSTTLSSHIIPFTYSLRVPTSHTCIIIGDFIHRHTSVLEAKTRRQACSQHSRTHPL